MTTSHRTSPNCPNCGHALSQEANFCPNCGQANHDLHVPFRHLVLEGIEGLIHFDSKSFRSIYTLLFKPGRLTNEFKAGRRTSYVPPIRLYIFLSFVFFLSLSLFTHSTTTNNLVVNADGQPVAEAEKRNTLDISFFDIKASDLKGLSDTQIDSVMQARKINQNAISKYMAHQVARLNGEGRTEFSHRLLKGVTYMMFVLMPIFALILYLLFKKRAEYYIDCLVFSVHYHAFAFLLFTIYLLIGKIIDIDLLILALPLVMGIYCFVALKTVFGQSWWMTLIKTVLTGALHTISIVFCLMMTVFISVALF
jgi:hypothetical protein